MITPKDVQRVANLAKLSISHVELDAFTDQINQILVFIEQLNTLDTSKVPPTAHAFGLESRLRDDLCQASLVFNEVLLSAPEHEDRFFKVPQVI